MSAPTWEIRQGDVLDRLREMPDESVHCVVTSPPYWGLRDYGTGEWVGGDPDCDHTRQNPREDHSHGDWSGTRGNQPAAANGASPMLAECSRCGAVREDHQIGLEATPEEYVAKMVEVFREVRRVLRIDGTCWLNLGDSYATGAGKVGAAPGGGAQGERWKDRGAMTSPNRMPIPGLKPKDLVGMPWRVAFALQLDGWYLRSDIIWAKPNPMPESVTDRPTKAHEYVFLLTKSKRYFYDAEAIAEPALRPEGSGSVARKIADGSDSRLNTHLGRSVPWEGTTRNRRTVWTIPTRPYTAAHFATFVPELPEICIKAGTSERGCCAECGAPWERVVESEFVKTQENNYAPERRGSATRDPSTRTDIRERGVNRTTTTGWRPTCNCCDHAEIDRPDEPPDAPLYPEPVPCTVLDPFAGSGTTLMVALRLGRDAIGIELNPEYVKLAEKRIDEDCPLFNRTPA